jgi:hypothetical protein
MENPFRKISDVIGELKSQKDAQQEALLATKKWMHSQFTVITPTVEAVLGNLREAVL